MRSQYIQHFVWTFLNKKAVFTVSLQRFTAVNQKQLRVENSERCLQLFQLNKKEFLHKYVTMDETWIYHFIPESNQQQVKAVQSDQRHKHQQARFWPLYFKMHKVFCSSIILRKEEPSIGMFEGRNRQKMATNEVGKNALSLRQCTVSQVDCNDGKTTWIALWIASTPTLFSSNYWLFADLKRMLQVKRFGSNWRSYIRNQGNFWDQRQVVLQKRHQIVKEALESVNHPSRRLYWWIKSNFASKLLFY